MFRSIRFRVVLLIFGYLALAVILSRTVYYYRLNLFVRENQDAFLQDSYFIMAAACRSSLEEMAPGRKRKLLSLTESFSSYPPFVSLLDSAMVWQEGQNLPEMLTQDLFRLEPASLNGAPRLTSISSSPGEAGFRVAWGMPVPGRILVVGQSLQPLQDLLWSYLQILIFVAPLIIIVLCWLAWYMLSWIFVPLNRISQTARLIEAGDLQQRIDLKDVDTELIGMAGTINTMLNRLENTHQALSRYGADVAHELQTPINSMLRSIAGEGGLPPDDKDAVIAACASQAQRMGKICQNLLLLSRADATVKPVTSIDLEPVACDALDLVAFLAKPREIVLENTVPSLIAVANANQIEQVLVNLLSNSIRFSPPGGTVTLAGHLEGSQVVLWVTDQGPGIPASDRLQLFNRFSKSRAGWQKVGNGLGLAICKSIIDAHSGTITCLDTGGRGTRMEVRLPAGVQSAES